MARRRKLGSMAVSLHKRRAAGTLLGRVAKRARMVAFRARSVTRTTTRRRVRRSTGKGEHVGVFTKCWNKRVRRFRRTAGSRAFARRVRGVMSTDLSKVTALTERALLWGIGLHADPSGTKRQRVGWLQLGLGVLQGQDYIQAYHDPYTMSVANPAGLTSCVLQSTEAANNNTLSSGVYSTIFQAFQAPVGHTNPVVSGTCHRFRLGPRRMHVCLRNPFQYGFWLDIFYCRCKKTVRKNELQDVATGTVGTTNYYGATSKFYGSPLECMAYGYPFVSDVGSMYHGTVKQASPQESPTFRRYWNVTKHCRVYLPPGGTLEKALVQRGSRMVTSEYINQYTMDRMTEYLLFRVCPEVQFGSSATGIPMNVGTGADGATPAIIGDVNWRYSYRQVQPYTENDEIGVEGYVPVTTSLKAGVAQPTSRIL